MNMDHDDEKQGRIHGAGGQGLYSPSLNHLGRSSEAKDRKKTEKVVLRTDGRTDKAGCRVA